MSESAHQAIMAFPEFITERRGVTYVKVKNNVVAAVLGIMFVIFALYWNIYGAWLYLVSKWVHSIGRNRAMWRTLNSHSALTKH